MGTFSFSPKSAHWSKSFQIGIWYLWRIFQHSAWSPTVSKKLWCVRFQQQWILFWCHQYGAFQPRLCSSLGSPFQEIYNGRNLVNFLWEKPPLFAFRSRFFQDDYQCTNFVISLHTLRQVQTSFVCQLLLQQGNLRVFSSFLNILRKMKNLSLPPPPSLLFCSRPLLVSYKNTDTRSWMEFSFICIVF